MLPAKTGNYIYDKLSNNDPLDVGMRPTIDKAIWKFAHAKRTSEVRRWATDMTMWYENTA